MLSSLSNWTLTISVRKGVAKFRIFGFRKKMHNMHKVLQSFAYANDLGKGRAVLTYPQVYSDALLPSIFDRLFSLIEVHI